MTVLPDWVQVLGALLTPMIAIGVAVIGFFQWHTNENKRKQELFDRRFDFYKRALSAYEEFHSERIGTTEAWEFEYFYIEAGFIFGDDIVEHLRNVSQNPKRDLAWFARPFEKYMRLK